MIFASVEKTYSLMCDSTMWILCSAHLNLKNSIEYITLEKWLIKIDYVRIFFFYPAS